MHCLNYKNKLSFLFKNLFYFRCNGKYQEWTEWSECSRSCQEYGKSGHKYRHRECLDRDGQQQDVSVCWELYGERSMEHAACNDFPCPQPCEVKPSDDSEKFFEIDCSARGYHTSIGVLSKINYSLKIYFFYNFCFYINFKPYFSPFHVIGKNISLSNGQEYPIAQINKWNLEGNHLTDECWYDLIDVIDRSKALECIKLGHNNFETVPENLFRCVRKVRKFNFL